MFRITVPATTANLGPGYDVLGMALSRYSFFECELSDKINIEIDGLEKDKLTIENNLVVKCMNRLFDEIKKYPKGYNLKIINNIPLARGLGSSATAIIGGLLSANAIMDFPLDNDKILELATEIEGHPDNVAPALFGNLIVSTKLKNNKVIYESITPFDGLNCVLFIPEYEVSTNDSRTVVPKSLSIQDTVHNMSHLSLMVIGFINGDTNLISQTMDDMIHEPYRKVLIKGFDEFKKSSYDAGAFAFSLSGAGSTIIAYTTEDTVENVRKAIQNTANKLNILGEAVIIKPCKNGAICKKIND